MPKKKWGPERSQPAQPALVPSNLPGRLHLSLPPLEQLDVLDQHLVVLAERGGGEETRPPAATYTPQPPEDISGNLEREKAPLCRAGVGGWKGNEARVGEEGGWVWGRTEELELAERLGQPDPLLIHLRLADPRQLREVLRQLRVERGLDRDLHPAHDGELALAPG